MGYKTRNRVYLEERRENKAHKFGETNGYTFISIISHSGKELPGFLTDSQIREALQRAKRNPEDIPKKRTWLDIIKGWFGCA